jgi:hypothetical protein
VEDQCRCPAAADSTQDPFTRNCGKLRARVRLRDVRTVCVCIYVDGCGPTSRNVSVRRLARVPATPLPLHFKVRHLHEQRFKQGKRNLIGHVDEFCTSLQYKLGVLMPYAHARCLSAQPCTTFTGVRRRPNCIGKGSTYQQAWWR